MCLLDTAFVNKSSVGSEYGHANSAGPLDPATKVSLGTQILLFHLCFDETKYGNLMCSASQTDRLSIEIC